MTQENKDVSLDEITEVINKLEGKLKDDRLSQQLRNSNVTSPDFRYQLGSNIKFNNINTNVANNTSSVFNQHGQPHVYYHQPTQLQGNQQIQYGISSKVIQSQSVPIQNYQNIIPNQFSENIGSILGHSQTIRSQNNQQLILRTKRLQQRLNQYQRFQILSRQVNKQTQQQLQELINIINFQQNEIVSLQSLNNNIQHQLKQALQSQRIYEQQLRAYKLKVVNLQRNIVKKESNEKPNQVFYNNKSDIFNNMMKKVQNKKRIGSATKEDNLSLKK